MRNWKYLMMSLALTGATATFTGCIDTDEPNGISELRSAKSELIKAQASLKLADVAYREAETAMKLAEVEGVKLANEGIKLANDKKQLELELQSAQNDHDKAEIQSKIAAIEEARKEAAEKHKAEMLKLEEATANAKESYDNAIKTIEAAKLLLTDDEIGTLDKAVENLETAEGILHEKLADIYDAQDKLNAAIKGALTNSEGAMEAALEQAIARAEFDLAAAEKGVEEVEALIAKAEKNATTTEWEKEVLDLEGKLLAWEVKESEANADIERIEIANKDKADKVDALKEAYEDADVAVIELEDYKLEITNETAKSRIAGNPSEFEYSDVEFSNSNLADAETVIEDLEGWLKDVEAATVNAEELAQATRKQKELQTALNTLTEAGSPYQLAVTEYNTARVEYNKEATTANYNRLVTASGNLYGTGLNNGEPFRLTEISVEDAKEYVADGGSYSNLGLFGNVAEATVNLDTAKELPLLNTYLATLTTSLDKRLKEVEKIVADNKKLVADAKDAWEAAEEAYDALFDEANLTLDEATAYIGMYKGLISTLESNIAKYLDGKENLEAFVEKLNGDLLNAQDGVVSAQGALDEAQHDYDLFKAGEYTEQYTITKAEAKLKTAKEAYEVAKARYDNAYAAVQNVISVLLD